MYVYISFSKRTCFPPMGILWVKKEKDYFIDNEGNKNDVQEYKKQNLPMQSISALVPEQTQVLI